MPDAGEPAPKKKSPVYRIGGVVLGVALVVGIFVGVIPQFASYREAWTAIAKMSPGWWAAVAVAAALSLAFAVWPFQAALPRLRYWPGFMEVQTSTAVSTTVPAGGALALGLTYRMFGSFGFTSVAITSAVATTGIWNLGFKFALPIGTPRPRRSAAARAPGQVPAGCAQRNSRQARHPRLGASPWRRGCWR